jgi:predicted Zn-dependent protease
MSINALTFALDDAAALLDSGNNDAAIDALRAADTPNDAQSCGLLARAYFQRGDTKGEYLRQSLLRTPCAAIGLR